jgi:hypothetical protein
MNDTRLALSRLAQVGFWGKILKPHGNVNNLGFEY